MTTKADTSVKWFHSGMADAPVLSGQAGKLIELLDACLINGFSVRTPDSIVVADGIATVSISAGNPYEKHVVIAISGASNAALNAEWRIATSGASSFTFLCPGVADGAVTGAAVKRAPAGWGKPFADTNVAAYQSLDPSSTQLYLRVNDATTDPRFALVRGYEQMTDANTGVNPFPTVAQRALTLGIWEKSDTASALSRPWGIVSDGLLFYVVAPYSSSSYPKNADIYRFGDIRSYVDGDKYNCVISFIASATHVSPPGTSVTSIQPNLQRNLDKGGGSYIARGRAQSGGAVNTARTSPGAAGAGGGTSPQTLPDLFFSPLWETETTGAEVSFVQTSPRGALPGFFLATSLTNGIAPWSVQDTDDGSVVLVAPAGYAYENMNRFCGFDIKGPWR